MSREDAPYIGKRIRWPTGWRIQPWQVMACPVCGTPTEPFGGFGTDPAWRLFGKYACHVTTACGTWSADPVTGVARNEDGSYARLGAGHPLGAVLADVVTELHAIREGKLCRSTRAQSMS